MRVVSDAGGRTEGPSETQRALIAKTDFLYGFLGRFRYKITLSEIDFEAFYKIKFRRHFNPFRDGKGFDLMGEFYIFEKVLEPTCGWV